MKQELETVTCDWKGCTEKVQVDQSMGCGMFHVVGWCKFHQRVYSKKCDIFETMVEEYNKKQLKNKFGRIIKFYHHSDVGNYLYQYDRKTFNQISKKALELVK